MTPLLWIVAALIAFLAIPIGIGTYLAYLRRTLDYYDHENEYDP